MKVQQHLPDSAISGRGPHDLRQVVKTHGIGAVVDRITRLHAEGNHYAASCLEHELTLLGFESG
ncbi:hypothetical protein [Nocardia transvalensis]|uniref:hypothetical protein n=1 Tax=Nocardia transvalensis TaxID=37333 RepID=UPI0018938EC9|nr:hypothetical protein [Nocardia transvalensis]MBF6329065.1 hypothetical protein [Nocardia transvalensis]